MAIAVADLIEVRWFCVLGDQTSVNVRHYRCDSILGTGASEQAAADSFSQAIAALYKALLSSQASYRGCGIRRVRPLPIGLETYSSFGTGVGTVTGNVLPRQTSCVVSLKTAYGGKKNRGRFYVAFPASGGNDTDGTPTAGYMVNVSALQGALSARINVGTNPNESVMVPVINHRKDGTSTDITTAMSIKRWATQRRRGSWGRPNVSPI